MRRRINFKHLRRWLARKARQYPKAAIGAMFASMCCGLGWLLASEPDTVRAEPTHAISRLYAKASTPERQRPLMADMFALVHLYTSVSAIEPDSLTAADSTLLKGIDEQLNSIIHEKDRL
ncbi:hypothetical protein [Pontibacter litorisediminis]|uniref:hypothetical protein n=1 Tax=Pontibacter litorisediminis TaxID=1846260 RepID=UPI0023EE119A|nr:hypothetical protein [Pontibacter litorisediminis]